MLRMAMLGALALWWVAATPTLKHVTPDPDF